MEILIQLLICFILYLIGEGVYYYWLGTSFTMDIVRGFLKGDK